MESSKYYRTLRCVMVEDVKWGGVGRVDQGGWGVEDDRIRELEIRDWKEKGHNKISTTRQKSKLAHTGDKLRPA